MEGNITGWSNWQGNPSYSSGWCMTYMTAQYGMVYQTLPTVTGNSYWFAADIQCASATNSTIKYLGMASAGGGEYDNISTATTAITRLSGIRIATTTSENVRVTDEAAASWTTWWFDNVVVVDLTAAFGAGNEPTLSECASIFSTGWFKQYKSIAGYAKANLNGIEYDYIPNLVLSVIQVSTYAQVSWA